METKNSPLVKQNREEADRRYSNLRRLGNPSTSMAENGMKNLDIQIERWPLDRLIPSDANPRTHTAEQVTKIAASIREFGFVSPILVGTDGRIIAGECRFRAALTLGLREVPVIALEHLSEIQRRALAIADNQLAINAGWDDAMLAVELTALRDEDGRR